MPRFTNSAGVVVDIPAELADRLGGYTPVGAAAAEGAPQDLDPAGITAWLEAEDAYRADVASWLNAEDSYRADVTAWLDAETAAVNARQTASQSNAGRGRK